MTETERAKRLANDHWNGYVSHMVEVHTAGANYTQAEVLAICKHHYISATIHGYKHAIEDEREGMFDQAITPARYAEIHTDLPPAEVNAITRPCSACLDEKKCGGGLRQDGGDCLHHRPKMFGLCVACVDGPPAYCERRMANALRGCTDYRPKVADQQHPRKEG